MSTSFLCSHHRFWGWHVIYCEQLLWVFRSRSSWWMRLPLLRFLPSCCFIKWFWLTALSCSASKKKNAWNSSCAAYLWLAWEVRGFLRVTRCRDCTEQMSTSTLKACRWAGKVWFLQTGPGEVWVARIVYLREGFGKGRKQDCFIIWLSPGCANKHFV